jgi:hypothetical protein
MNIRLATKLGMSAAICAQCLWDGIAGAFLADVGQAKGRQWIRMSHRQLALLIPYLSPNMAKSALRRLVRAGIVRTTKLNENAFDHTYWYSFTPHGEDLMLSVIGEED